jgi:hypothetical protein
MRMMVPSSETTSRSSSSLTIFMSGHGAGLVGDLIALQAVAAAAVLHRVFLRWGALAVAVFRDGQHRGSRRTRRRR